MTLRTSWIAGTAVLLVSASACTGGSDTVEVPGAETTVVTAAPAATSEPDTEPPVETELPTPTPAPRVTEAPTPTETPPPTETASPSTTPPAPEVAPETTQARNPDFLRQGDEGPRIGLIQFKLVAVGYLPTGSDTGVFDAATNSAVLAFQGDYGLIVDGIIGPETDRDLGGRRIDQP